MQTTADKTRTPAISHKQENGSPAFFRKSGEEGFFGNQPQPSFFSPVAVQAKLSVSHPDDPQEKEADAVADHVMRMPDPAAAPMSNKEEDKVHRKEDGVGFEIQRSALSYAEIPVAADESQETTPISRKANSLFHSDIIQRSGRGPPTGIMQFENNLHSSKGYGMPMPESTQQFMQSRFNADFSGVRIHTGSYAENMSGSIQAQAFTHGSDVYFNSGKFAPHTEAGGTLLAHELTHTIQQGAVHTNSTSPSSSPSSVQRKDIVQRVPSGPVPQLTNAVEKAKTKEGKINAGKEGPDGNREGWQDLLEIFKSTFGDDKIISGAGGTVVPGTVAEQDIKKKRMATGMKVNKDDVNGDRITGERDAMPSWCGIFVFWALNKSGVPMPKWTLGRSVIKPEAAYPPGYVPKTGDIAYKEGYSHYAIVESATADTVRSVNGNTAGEDNLGGQVQTREHPMSNWTAFFNPLLNMQGTLGSGEGAVAEKPKTLRELRRELFKVNRKADGDHEDEHQINQVDNTLKAGPELSALTVSKEGNIQSKNNPESNSINPDKIQLKEEEHKEEEKQKPAKESIVQKKAGDGFSSDNENCCNENNSSPIPYPVQTKEEAETHNHVANTTGNYTIPNTSVQNRGPPVQISRSEERVQCGWFDSALSVVNSAIDFVAEGLEAGKRLLLTQARDFVMAIPGYRALRVVLGEDPITSEVVERNGHNFIEAAFDIMPGGRLLHQKLEELGALTEAEAFVDRRIVEIEGIVHNVTGRVETFWNGLTLDSLASPRKVFEDAGNIIHGAITSVVDFAENAARELLSIVKHWLLTQIVDFIRTRTTAYPLLCVILGKDPVTDQQVARNGTNILNALLELGGEEGIQQRTQMQETGTFKKVVGYIDEGIAVFGNLYDTIKNNFGLIWSVVSIDALMHPIDTFNRLYNTFADPLLKVWNFVRKVAVEILRLIKDALMKRLSAWARQQRGFTLVTVIIGSDPFTHVPVPFTMENVIKGFFGLMEGGEEQYNQLKASGAIDRTVAKVTAAVARLNMTPAAIIQLFIDLWHSFSLNDLIHPIDAFMRILAKFGEPIGRLIAFVIEIVKIVIEAILIVMNFPFDLINNIIAKAMQAYDLIKKDPVKFLKNLLRAIKEGFMQFFDNILTHLFNGLKAWFIGEVEAAGIPIPTDFTVMGIIKWLLVVLDVTMEKIWKKLEDRIGKPKVDKIRKMIDMAEKVANAAGEAYEFMQDVQKRGFMAVMIDKIKEQLSNVWEMVLDAVKGFVMDQIIKKVTAKLLSMLDPTGIMAVVNSAIALYKAIQSFIKYLRKMLEIVNSFVEGTLQIAQGATKKAADFLEGALARGIPIVIGFLANQVGLNLSERLKDALEIVREKVDKGLTWVIDKLVGLIEKLVAMGKAAVGKVLGWLGLRKEFTLPNGDKHEIYFEGSEESPSVLVASSTPHKIEQLVSNRKTSTTAPALNPVQDAALSNALAKKTEMDNFIKTNKASTPGGGTATTDISSGINTRLDAIKTDLIAGDAIPATAALPLSNVTYSTEGAKAKTVVARPLTKMPGNTTGSAPVQVDSVPPGWQHIRVLEGAKITMWVKAHMLNENLHGPGLGWNLVPATQQFNSQMRVECEKWAKDEVKKDEIIHYKAEVTGWHNKPGNPLISNFFPSTVTVTYGYMVNPAKPGRTQETTFVNSYSQDPPPEMAGGAGPPNINTMSRENIRDMFTGVVNADQIYNVRQNLPNKSYRDLGHMYLRLLDAYNKSAEFKNTYWPIISQKFNFANAFKF